MIGQIKRIAPVVEGLLETNPELRDNDRKLLLTVWQIQEPALSYPIGGLQFSQFAEAFALGRFVNPESVRRSRASIQRRRPELRGKLYGKRKGSLEAGVRGGIKDV